MHAVLMLVVSLVHGVRATFGMRFNRRDRDWHADEMREALPRTKPGIHLRKDTVPTESLSALCRESLLANPKGLKASPLEALNRVSRHKAENDTIGVERLATRLSIRALRAGGDPGGLPA